MQTAKRLLTTLLAMMILSGVCVIGADAWVDPETRKPSIHGEEFDKTMEMLESFLAPFSVKWNPPVYWITSAQPAKLAKGSVAADFAAFKLSGGGCCCSCHRIPGAIHVMPCCDGYSAGDLDNLRRPGTSFELRQTFLTDKAARPYFQIVTEKERFWVAADEEFVKLLAADGIKLSPLTTYESIISFETGKASEFNFVGTKLQAEKADPKQANEAVQKAAAKTSSLKDMSRFISSRRMVDQYGRYHTVVFTLNPWTGEVIDVFVMG